MKKIIGFLFLFLCVCVSFACSNEKDSSTNTEEDNLYSITVTGNKEYLIEDVTGNYEEGTWISIKTQILSGKDVKVYVNDTEILKSVKMTGNYYLFGFEMPSKDVIVEIKIVDFMTIDSVLGMLDFFDKEDVVKVRREFAGFSVDPFTLTNVQYSTDPIDISNAVDFLNTPVTEICEEDTHITGGSYVEYKYYTNTECYSLLVTNGYITVLNSDNICSSTLNVAKFYKLLSGNIQFLNPSLECCSFGSSFKEYDVFNNKTNEFIETFYNFNEFEFIEIETEIITEPIFRIENEINNFYVYDENTFAIKNNSIYKIVGEQNFSFLFNDAKYLSDYYNFLNEIDVEDILEVQYIDSLGSVAPGTLQNTLFSNDKSDIANIFKYFKNLTIYPNGNDDYIPIEPGYSIDYYTFVTEDDVYVLYLYQDYLLDNLYYSTTYDVPEMENGVEAFNFHYYKDSYDVYYTLKTEFILDNIDYLSHIMFKEYDNDKLYYLSDVLYVDFEGYKIRISSSNSFEYNGKYYVIIGSVDFLDVYMKTMIYSYIRKEVKVTVRFPIKDDDSYLIEVIYMAGQTLNVDEITEILRSNLDRPINFTYYLDIDRTIPLEEMVLEENITIYVCIELSSDDLTGDFTEVII